MRLEQFLVKSQKALRIVKEQGLSALLDRMKSEVDPARDFDFTQRSALSSSPPKERKAIFVGRILNKNQLVTKIQAGLSGKYTRISFSHDDYLSSVGGLQIRVADEQEQVNAAGNNYLHIFPYGASLTLTEFDLNSIIGINLNGKRIGYTNPDTFLESLQVIIESAPLEQISIHHTMGFDLAFIEKAIMIAGEPKVRFWLHDFFSVCPGYLLLRNNIEFCGAPDVSSNACGLCVYGTDRWEHLVEFERFFSQNTIEVISPSEFALDLWNKSFPIKGVTASVCPHAYLEYKQSAVITPQNSTIRIAFVGFPVHHKGWSTWQRLTERFGSDSRYEFFLFSETRRRSQNFKHIPVSVTKDTRSQMSDMLQGQGIDVAFLWSICPETFSYTLYESLAAGCVVLTNPDSGNIQSYVRDHPEAGMVLDDENALMELFDGKGLVNLVAERQTAGKKITKLVITHDCK